MLVKAEKEYLLEKLKEDYYRTCYYGAAYLYRGWEPQVPLTQYIVILRCCDLLPPKLTGAGFSESEALEMTDEVMTYARERWKQQDHTDLMSGGLTVEDYIADAEARPLTRKRLEYLFVRYRNRTFLYRDEERDAENLETLRREHLVTRVTEFFLEHAEEAVKNMRLQTLRPETEFEKQKREARERREHALWEAKCRKEANEAPVKDLCVSDLRWIDDIDKLCMILRGRDDRKLVQETIDRIYHLRMEDDIEVVESCLPGKCTWDLLRFVCKEQKISEYTYVTSGHRGHILIPALQQDVNYEAEDLLDSLYHRKYHHYVNREKKHDLDYWEALEQFDRAETPEEAFRDISPYDYDKWYEFDDSDEFSYLDSLDEKPFSIGGYDLHAWRLHCLREADLLTEEDM